MKNDKKLLVVVREFQNDDDDNVHRLNNFSIGIGNGHSGSIITPSHGSIHRDSSIQLLPSPTPNFCTTKSLSKLGVTFYAVRPTFMKLTPGLR